MSRRAEQEKKLPGSLWNVDLYSSMDPVPEANAYALFVTSYQLLLPS